MPNRGNRVLVLELLLRQKFHHIPVCMDAANEIARLAEVERQYIALRSQRMTARKTMLILCACAFLASFSSSYMRASTLTKTKQVQASPKPEPREKSDQK